MFSGLKTVVPRYCHGCNNTIVLECSILGGGATVWQGNLFNQCQNHDDIVLRHSQFNSTGAMINITCDNNLTISGYAVDVNEDVYTSCLIIDFSEDLSGWNVECANQSKKIIESCVIPTAKGLIFRYCCQSLNYCESFYRLGLLVKCAD